MKNNFWRKNFFITILFLKKTAKLLVSFYFLMRFGEENNIKNAIWRKKKYHITISNTGKYVIKLFDEYKKMMLEKKAKKKVSFSPKE
nr:hypothetical protein [Bacteroides intestinalis]